MSLLCQLWTLNETIQALKEQRTRQNNSVSPVPEGDSEDGGGGPGVIMEEDGAQAWEELDDEDLGDNGSPSGRTIEKTPPSKLQTGFHVYKGVVHSIHV